ncbi:MAG: hypothetical protein LC721_08750 [Actinobacteria bacterium]|nr:hypothetical protein [Actinomycetota bacterium]
MTDESFEAFLLANRDAQKAMGTADREDPWAGSPFDWLMRLPSRSRGKAGELLAEAWLRRLGLRVDRPVSGDHDRVVAGKKVEIKFSTLWAGGEYVFQQLRDQDYELVLLLGVSPTMAHGWVVPKWEAFERAVPQHGGARGSDTRWLRFSASAPPAWLSAFGGDLGAFEVAIGEFLGA